MTEGDDSSVDLLQLFQEWDRDLHCAICHGKYREPVALKCLHSFCRSCIQLMSDTLKTQRLTCPTCRTVTLLDKKKGVEGLVRNWHLDDMRERVNTGLQEASATGRRSGQTGQYGKKEVIPKITIQCDEQQHEANEAYGVACLNCIHDMHQYLKGMSTYTYVSEKSEKGTCHRTEVKTHLVKKEQSLMRLVGVAKAFSKSKKIPELGLRLPVGKINSLTPPVKTKSGQIIKDLNHAKQLIDRYELTHMQETKRMQRLYLHLASGRCVQCHDFIPSMEGGRLLSPRLRRNGSTPQMSNMGVRRRTGEVTKEYVEVDTAGSWSSEDSDYGNSMDRLRRIVAYGLNTYQELTSKRDREIREQMRNGNSLDNEDEASAEGATAQNQASNDEMWTDMRRKYEPSSRDYSRLRMEVELAQLERQTVKLLSTPSEPMLEISLNQAQPTSHRRERRRRRSANVFSCFQAHRELSSPREPEREPASQEPVPPIIFRAVRSETSQGCEQFHSASASLRPGGQDQAAEN